MPTPKPSLRRALVLKPADGGAGVVIRYLEPPFNQATVQNGLGGRIAPTKKVLVAITATGEPTIISDAVRDA